MVNAVSIQTDLDSL